MTGKSEVAPLIADSNLVCYALLGVAKYGEEAMQVLESLDEIVVPELFRAEVVNVLWQMVQHADVDISLAHEALDDADSLIDRIVPTTATMHRALELGVAAKHPTYDLHYVSAAELLGTKLVTYDARLRRKFNDITVAPPDLLD
ncbi:MAG: type II toxin-antitoxin system VapC family toxin [Myxococcota bacterium]